MSTEKLRRAALPPVQENIDKLEKAINEDIIFVHLKSSVDPSALRDKVIFANWQRNRRKPEELNAGKKVNSRKILMQFEQDQKEKYEKAIAALTEMEKRAVMAESMEEATLHYHSGQNKAKPSLSPRCVVDFPLSNLLCLGEKHFIMDDKTKPGQLVQLVLQRTW
ncbi:hypothetical protein ES319_D05G371400v1 [Gossypium barbadense]|uniref:Uncharacterized protein n=1 Tax=Gossypium barbadense TaxID=3634 RepID=A0A5J5RMI8_GOSBA|nr:hypothetical protein ES319_D05G371400v1 [Gossypium barbadense]